MSSLSEETDIECPHCGALAPAEVMRCPECGQSFYPEDEPGVPAVRERETAGLLQRVITLLMIGGLAGGGLSLVMGAGWVWLVLVGALVFGLLGLFWDRLG